ncbi:hypothetical protein B0H12DRAFT_1231428 [Mycena haematopus]|nr:hypothetical protein B0H12DRAFT_1235211 [Mycena haematopus]KAJ7261782.1 hypothetical protein B0H12DRAFT_1231428 [Mycena haematopus]
MRTLLRLSLQLLVFNGLTRTRSPVVQTQARARNLGMDRCGKTQRRWGHATLMERATAMGRRDGYGDGTVWWT